MVLIASDRLSGKTHLGSASPVKIEALMSAPEAAPAAERASK
jgi:hypothetical protein